MSKQRFTIGRAGDIPLYDDTVSRRHACLEIDDGAFFLRDLDSRNGTYEIRDKNLVPFKSGVVYPEQVFAFGECVRSVAQLLSQVGAEDAPSTAHAGAGQGPLDATHAGISVPPRQRLTRSHIVEILEKIEDQIALGANLQTVCEQFGITEQRYERWCKEHGGTRAEREKMLALLFDENDRLRRRLAEVLREREALQEALREHGIGVALEDTSELNGTAAPAAGAATGDDAAAHDSAVPEWALVGDDTSP